MVNVLGGPADGRPRRPLPGRAWPTSPAAKFHFYGKDRAPGPQGRARHGAGDDLDDVVFRARAAAAHFDD